MDIGVAGARRLERGMVPGGGTRRWRLAAGDRVCVTDPQGLQACDIVLPDAPAALASCPPSPSSPSSQGRRVLAEGNPAGARFAFSVDATTDCIIAAPGSPMPPDAQHPPTALLVEISRTLAAAPNDLPAPLAEPLADLRVPAATAAAYRVAAGDYIQIIDVDGRQCSDFLAFDAAALARGEEHGIDPTTTRTLMGATTPGPGLHGKFLDDRMRPLVEVVQDTVGRHDTFMLACAAKYYDDLGYPGHANCTDNFNAALAPHGVAARAGWPAINFFYNTFVASDGSIGMDEPWSRPGDYVLLRALTDLVCASSSCADDVDPANAWQPTDIHVRLYDKSHAFAKGIAHRMTPDAIPEMTRESGFHPRTSALTRSFTEYRGFWLPTCFTDDGPVAEYWACRERAVVTDLSALRKFEVTGPDAEALVQRAVTRDIRKLAVGQVVYTAMCHAHGGMIDDATVFRLAAQNFRVVCGDDYCGVWLRELAAAHGLHVWVRASTDQLHNIAVQGPRSRDILRTIVSTPPARATVEELKWFRFTAGRLGDAPVLISRTGYTGELGYEVWCHPDAAPRVWDAVWEAGAPHGLRAMGLAALDIVRIEAGLAFGGYEFCDQTDPFEAGIGFTVPADKPDDYVGSEALARRRASPQRKLVGLDVAGAETVGTRRSGARRPRPHRRRHQRRPLARARPHHRARPARRRQHRARNGGRDRQARRPAEAHRRHRDELPALRPAKNPRARLTFPVKKPPCSIVAPC